MKISKLTRAAMAFAALSPVAKGSSSDVIDMHKPHVTVFNESRENKIFKFLQNNGAVHTVDCEELNDNSTVGDLCEIIKSQVKGLTFFIIQFGTVAYDTDITLKRIALSRRCSSWMDMLGLENFVYLFNLKD